MTRRVCVLVPASSARIIAEENKMGRSAAMTLRRLEGLEPSDQIDRQAVKFVMLNDVTGERVDCFASFVALHNIEGGAAPDRVERMERFDRNRLAFETIAASKHDRG